MDELLKIANNPVLMRKWKQLAAKNLYDFSKRNNPYKVKISKHYLYIDTRSYTYSIVLSGVKPNAGAVRSYNAPVNQYTKTPPYKEYYGGRWHTLKKARKTAGFMGLTPLNTKYYGESGTPTKYFGIRKGGKIRAYGLYDDNDAVPVYSDKGFVEWWTQQNLEELYAVLQETGFKCINEVQL